MEKKQRIVDSKSGYSSQWQSQLGNAILTEERRNKTLMKKKTARKNEEICVNIYKMVLPLGVPAISAKMERYDSHLTAREI